MVIFRSSGDTRYKPPKEVRFEWNTFRKGLNTLLRENEVDKDELTQADNIVLIGKGIPTRRGGLDTYYQAGNATGIVRGLKGLYYKDGTKELVALTDDGYLTKKSGETFSTLQGASWASGYDATMAQLGNSLYISTAQRELVRYSTPTLVGFPTIARPTITGASNISNATGTNTYGYKITSISQVGETIGTDTFELKNQPEEPGGDIGGTVRLVWTAPSTASGILQGFNIYGRSSGYERFLAGVPASATTWFDDGSSIPSEFTFSPTADSTGGPKAKYVIRFEDRLVFAGLDGEPTKIIISGRYPYHERFDLSFGGNYISVEPDAGDPITGLIPFRDRVIVFKERSIWQLKLGQEQIGNFFVTTPVVQLITASHGCIAPKSIAAVENDVFFLSRRGINSLGYEQGFAIDTLFSKEISMKIKPFFKSLTIIQQQGAVAKYFDDKYFISFPGLTKTMVFDRLRMAWVGPWNFDANVFEVYYDDDNVERLLKGCSDCVNVDEWNEVFTDDNGTAIGTTLRTRQEVFGDWSIFKNIKNLFMQFRNVTGTVDVDIRIEKRSGLVNTAKSFTITPATGDSGWGADIWANTLFGDSETGGGGADTQQFIKWVDLNKAARTLQFTMRTDGINDNYELLGIRGDARPIGSGFRPSSWKT